MPINEQLLSLPLVELFTFLFGLSFFLNYLSALYSDVNLFKIDLVKKRKKGRKVKKLIFILKNGNLLFAMVCFCQVLLNISLSEIFVSGLSQPIFEKRG
jgi:hypothetical protein